MIRLWLPRETKYLAKHFATKPVEAIAFHLGRSAFAVRSKARQMKLHRPNLGRFGANNVPKKDSPLRDRIEWLFEESPVRTIAEATSITGSDNSSCYRAFKSLCKAGKIHVSGYRHIRGFRNIMEAVYTAGPGEDAPKPVIAEGAKRTPQTYKPDPIPRPQLGVWGQVW